MTQTPAGTDGLPSHHEAHCDPRLSPHQRFVPRERNRRSLHSAPPDFLLRVVALAEFVRLSLRKAAYVDVDECRVVGNPGTLRSG